MDNYYRPVSTSAIARGLRNLLTMVIVGNRKIALFYFSELSKHFKVNLSIEAKEELLIRGSALLDDHLRAISTEIGFSDLHNWRFPFGKLNCSTELA